MKRKERRLGEWQRVKRKDRQTEEKMVTREWWKQHAS
jgi:hypothetical protein